MSLPALLTEPCTVIPMELGQDEDGDPDPQEGESFDTLCYAEPRTSSESDDRTNQQQTDWFIAFLPDEPVTGLDRIVIRDMVLEVVGPPREWRNPRTRAVSHLEADARWVEQAPEGT